MHSYYFKGNVHAIQLLYWWVQQVIQIYFFSPPLKCLMCIKWCWGKYRFTPPPAIWALPGLRLPAHGAAAGLLLPLRTQGPGPSCSGGKRAGQGVPAALLLAERGFPPAGVHGVRTNPIASTIILLFSTYLQSAVQTLINDSVIARGKSWQREGWQLALPGWLAGSQPFLCRLRGAGWSLTGLAVICSNYSSGDAGGGF